MTIKNVYRKTGTDAKGRPTYEKLGDCSGMVYLDLEPTTATTLDLTFWPELTGVAGGASALNHLDLGLSGKLVHFGIFE